ncbi:hypothetical protein BDN72DRAFT_274566 [Pluteus cervinus]|uniref:Uncharacterized protein n=1 Tax=Pluteus cervinus TaxID=181527 RepID=A0ACD3AEK2_9AGAR|nr:hypothetical protein BDN72DRAFT_274566 [Pluteus cervinus]
MQFTSTFSYITSALFASLAFQMTVVDALPTSSPLSDISTALSIISSTAKIIEWISHTNASLNFIGDLLDLRRDTIANPLWRRQAQNVQVVYCDTQIGDSCGGTCTVYNGPNICLEASHTSCLMASADVGFCDRDGCGGSCHDLSTCGTALGNGFCSTPGTASISVPFV